MEHILVIDDDELVRQVLQSLLRSQGYSVETAQNGKEGLEKFNHEQPDIVMTDIFMPEKRGFDVISEIRKSNPEVGIVAMTGRETLNNSTILRYAKELGADDCVKKPVKREKLLSLIEGLIKRRKSIKGRDRNNV